MNIALDFDKTYTEDPALWSVFIGIAHSRGHNILIVTSRDEHNDGINWDAVGGKPLVPVIWCDGRPKSVVCEEQNLSIDVWIDDLPSSIHGRAGMFSKQELHEWRTRDSYRHSSVEPHGESRGFEKG